MMSEGSVDSRPAQQHDAEADPTRDRILQAAGRVFGDLGYARATTRAIAAEAGVNEVTLFRHFRKKENLFAAVIERYAAPALTNAIDAQLSGDYRQDLLDMGRVVAQALIQRHEAIRLMLCEAAHFPEVRRVMARNPRQLRQALARYLEGQIAQGRVRAIRPEVAAQVFWGMFFSYAVSQSLLEETIQPPLALEALIAEFVDIFVAGTVRLDPASGDLNAQPSVA